MKSEKPNKHEKKAIDRFLVDLEKRAWKDSKIKKLVNQISDLEIDIYSEGEAMGIEMYDLFDIIAYSGYTMKFGDDAVNEYFLYELTDEHMQYIIDERMYKIGSGNEIWMDMILNFPKQLTSEIISDLEFYLRDIVDKMKTTLAEVGMGNIG